MRDFDRVDGKKWGSLLHGLRIDRDEFERQGFDRRQTVAAATVLYPGHRNELEISQEEISYLSGVSRQRVNQALQVLARTKLVEVEYGSVRIVDLAALRRYGG